MRWSPQARRTRSFTGDGTGRRAAALFRPGCAATVRGKSRRSMATSCSSFGSNAGASSYFNPASQQPPVLVAGFGVGWPRAACAPDTHHKAAPARVGRQRDESFFTRFQHEFLTPWAARECNDVFDRVVTHEELKR